MTARRRPAGQDIYITAVTVTGLAALALLASAGGWATARQAPLTFWLLAACVLVSDCFQVRLAAPLVPERILRVTPSELSLGTLLLGWGLPAAALVAAPASAIADLLQRRPLRAVAGNAAVYVLTLVTAEGVYRLAGGDRPFTLDAHLPAWAAASLTYALVNTLLVNVCLALESRGAAPAWSRLRWQLWWEALPDALMLCAAPAVLLLAALGGVPLLLLLALPTIALHLVRLDVERAQQRRAEAQARERSKGELLAIVSHELRGPLSGILGVLTTLHRRGEALRPAQREELITLAQQQGDRLRHLVEQLLLAARLEEVTEAPAEQAVVDAGEALRQAALAAQCAHPDRHFEVRAYDTLPVRASMDVLRQVLGNLLDNAAKYSPAATPVRLEGLRRDSLAVLAVEDQGPGVPPAERERVFERFTQLNGEQQGGVGLGLYIARQLARSQGGELVATDPTGAAGGARFELRLALAPDAEAPLAGQRPGKAGNGVP